MLSLPELLHPSLLPSLQAALFLPCRTLQDTSAQIPASSLPQPRAQAVGHSLARTPVLAAGEPRQWEAKVWQHLWAPRSQSHPHWQQMLPRGPSEVGEPSERMGRMAAEGVGVQGTGEGRGLGTAWGLLPSANSPPGRAGSSSR